MERKSEPMHPDRRLEDLKIENEPVGFQPEEMIVCNQCQRKSPPTRATCFYCGANLPVSEIRREHLKLNLRKLEEWEKGFNIIYLPKSEKPDSRIIADIAKTLRCETDDAEALFKADKPLPAAHAESPIEAEVITKHLAERGVQSVIVTDEQLGLKTVTRRLRGIEFLADKLVLILFNADEIAEILYEDLALIVVGAVFERKIEAVSSIKRKEKEKILDSTETGTDELLIDIYSKNDSTGYRIESTGFDFSCLEAEKSLLVKDNMKKLAEKFRAVSPNAAFDNDYLRFRGELGKVWETREESNSIGVNRVGMGGFKRTNITIINNLTQFTRYSRLQRQLL